MNTTNYIGEHLWVGQVGHLAVLVAFAFAILSAISYFLSVQAKEVSVKQQWMSLGRMSFYIHAISVFTIIALIFYAMYNHMYEYAYVYDHVSDDLPIKYILSAFWEGQEGSFLLWMFWHVILGMIMIKKLAHIEASTLFTIALAEVILMTMLLGIHLPGSDEAIKIGSNPFVLLRETTEAPIFANADYLSLIKGRGLNPLLQNYWMTIHPPTLFLGFASTIVPFALAVHGLWLNDHKEWLKTTLPWSLFSAGILGIGILMGSLWAYVALSFGGYWAWDPVENASLVPWITLVAGIHVHMINKNTGYAGKSVYFYYLVSFLLILYSTFLTRSGVLGDTSAHAFTEMGLEWQLAILIGLFIVLGFGLLAYRFNDIKGPKEEEKLPSKEFWMFIGSLVLLFSAVLITVSTSLPVFNKIMTYFDAGFENRTIKDPIEHYNKYQLWIVIFISFLTSAAMFLRYSATNWEAKRAGFIKKNALYALFTLGLTVLITFWIKLYSWQFYAMCFAAIYSVVANGDYIVSTVKGNVKLAYGAIAHLGFGLMLIGTLASGLNQKFISSNPFVFKGMFEDQDLERYVQLIKGKPLFSQGYLITYQNDTLIGRERKYSINFQKVNDSLAVIDDYTLHPTAMYSNDMSKIAAYNPDTKHYIHKDIFTCVVGVPPALESIEKAKEIEDSLKFVSYNVTLKDTLVVKNLKVIAKEVTLQPNHAEFAKHKHDAGIGVIFDVLDEKTDSIYTVEASLGVEGALVYNYPGSVNELGIKIRLTDKVMDTYFADESNLDYSEFTIKNGQSFKYGDTEVSLDGFNKTPTNANYKPEEGDIAIGAKINIQNNGQNETLEPVYIIRKNQPFSIKQYSPVAGLHIRFSNINPTEETFTFKVAKENKIQNQSVAFEMATDIPRTDYLILQATIFPGINLFWVGSILMMVALLMAAWSRRSKSYG